MTEATYTGTAASSDAHLNGPITVDVRSIYDATTNAGSLTGDVQINNSSTSFEGRLTAVNVNGHVQGFLTGRESGGGEVLGNVTASFSASGGFNSPSSMATIGAGTGTNSAIVTGTGCSSSLGHQEGDDNDQDENTGDNNTTTSNHSVSNSFGSGGSHDHHGDQDGQN